MRDTPSQNTEDGGAKASSAGKVTPGHGAPTGVGCPSVYCCQAVSLPGLPPPPLPSDAHRQLSSCQQRRRQSVGGLSLLEITKLPRRGSRKRCAPRGGVARRGCRTNRPSQCPHCAPRAARLRPASAPQHPTRAKTRKLSASAAKARGQKLVYRPGRGAAHGLQHVKALHPVLRQVKVRSSLLPRRSRLLRLRIPRPRRRQEPEHRRMRRAPRVHRLQPCQQPRLPRRPERRIGRQDPRRDPLLRWEERLKRLPVDPWLAPFLHTF